MHHAHPGIPWYRLERTYRARRDAVLANNNGYVYRSYWTVMRLYLLRPKDDVAHPYYGRLADGPAAEHGRPGCEQAGQAPVLDRAASA